MDPVDTASEFIENELALNLARTRFLATADATCGGTTFCVDCGDEIDPKRKEANPTCERCFDCQQKLEKARRRF